ncbi:NUDIX hydrolase [Actinacidiphila sp. ITFR-21]|uniref:NUDIX hydrolase n=1 Tax=Actinacidiphila sp. ITFR-21 TaxID=3075199 RepID=UPI00288AD212|nr:NUDIX hydrolase [Streptomyces sp. ITFR-21]WNI17062.1 NUDIX hydrolase [Streptomyces sp. ITFR-21]
MPSYKPPLWPVSVKAVVFDGEGRVFLLENERAEWELPGGRLEISAQDTGEPADVSPESAVEREVLEETGWQVEAGSLVDGGVWVYEPVPGRRDLIVTCGCTVRGPYREPVASHEHKPMGLHAVGDVPGLAMSDRYKQSILTRHGRL